MATYLIGGGCIVSHTVCAVVRGNKQDRRKISFLERIAITRQRIGFALLRIYGAPGLADSRRVGPGTKAMISHRNAKKSDMNC